MSFIVILASLAALIVMARKSYREAFIDVYVPTLICLPTWCRWPIPGLPDPTFQQAAILPIAAAFIVRGRKNYRFSLLDPFVIGLLALIGYSEYVNAGYNEAQNLIFDMVASGFLPYILAKSIIEPSGYRARFARNIVWCTALVIVTTIYEARFAYNPFRLFLDPFFPGQGEGWVMTFRYGLARVAGPYGHAILAGVMFMFALRLQTWLQASNLWEPNFRFINLGKLTKAKLLTAWTFFGLCLTWVRGPQLGTLFAWLFSLIGRGKNPRKRGIVALGAIVVIGVPAAIAFNNYASVGRAQSKSDSQETAAYRKELIDKYVDIALQHAALGWGRNGWPKIAGMPSIDNYYLLLALMHGVIAPALLFLILAITCVRLYRNGMQSAPLEPPGSSLSFDLFGIYIGFAFSIATVYMGENVLPMFFIMLGFTEGYLLAGGDRSLSGATVATQLAPVQAFRFRRVVA